MTYQSLARKYRPQRFSDLIGQDSVALALGNAIKIGRAPAAVIFSGVRGVGKTTSARLYAKALNCAAPNGVDPCGTCASCEAIVSGVHEDVVEIDGASNNGVDEVRALKESTHYVPQRSRYKVYIIDEVHMLSGSAFNALLKTLEEPPSSVVFVFATTELQKVPQTVISRCQTFYLKKISEEDLMHRIREILQWEKIPFDENALPVIARCGRGSMRDALSALDQAVALGEGKVDGQSVQSFGLGSGLVILQKLLPGLIAKDAKAVIDCVEELDEQGLDFQDCVEELCRMLRSAFLLEAKLSAKVNDIEYYHKLLKTAQPFDFNRLFRSLIQCLKEMNGSVLDRFVFENYLLEWCLDPGLPKVAELLASEPQVKAPLSMVQAVVASAQPASPVQVLASPAPLVQSMPSMQAASSPAPAPQERSKGSLQSWPELVEGIKRVSPMGGRLLEEAYLVSFAPDLVKIAVNAQGMGATLLAQDKMQKMQDLMKTHLQFQGRFVVIPRDATSSNSGESILEAKTRQNEVERTQALEAARTHPATRAFVEKMGAEVANVSLHDL